MANSTKAATQLLCDVKKMLHHFEEFSFFKIKRSRQNLMYNGENVKQNIQNEWFISNSITCDEPSFLSSSLQSTSDVLSTYKAVKSINKVLPCTIVGSGVVKSTQKEEAVKMGGSDLVSSLMNCFNNEAGTKLQRYLICSPDTSNNYFYKIQRDRQVWWKKFSAVPGRFSLSQVFRDTDKLVVEIHAQFQWGVSTTEKIQLLFNAGLDTGKDGVQSEVHAVASEMLLEKATIALLCDSYEDANETGRQMLRFHKKLAPYKVSFAAVTSSDTAEERNLKDLALLLTKQIRRNATSVLLLSDMCSTPLEEQIARNDALGIPYTVIMDENTLKNGLLGIRSRDTTLKEDSHVSLLVSYVEKLLKNY